MLKREAHSASVPDLTVNAIPSRKNIREVRENRNLPEHLAKGKEVSKAVISSLIDKVKNRSRSNNTRVASTIEHKPY